MKKIKIKRFYVYEYIYWTYNNTEGMFVIYTYSINVQNYYGLLTKWNNNYFKQSRPSANNIHNLNKFTFVGIEQNYFKQTELIIKLAIMY